MYKHAGTVVWYRYKEGVVGEEKRRGGKDAVDMEYHTHQVYYIFFFSSVLFLPGTLMLTDRNPWRVKLARSVQPPQNQTQRGLQRVRLWTDLKDTGSCSQHLTCLCASQWSMEYQGPEKGWISLCFMILPQGLVYGKLSMIPKMTIFNFLN